MKEHTLYDPLLAGAREEGWLLYRLKDAGAGRSPFDLGGADERGIAVGIEVKVWGKLPDLEAPLSQAPFEAQQIGWLNAFGEQPAIALAVVAVPTTPHLLVFRVTGPHFWQGPCGRHTAGTLWKDKNVYRGWKGLAL